MKVLYLHQYFSTPDGAAGIRSYEMALRLVARGHRVLMVCGSAERGTTGLSGPFVAGKRRGVVVEGIEVLEFELGYSNRDGFVKRTITFLSFAAQCIKVVLTERYDLIFATSTPLTVGIPGVLARWLRQKPFVFEVRDLWPELPRAMGVIRNPLALWAMGVLEWSSYRSAHRLIGLSPGIVDGIAKRGVERSHIALVPNGCDLDIFSVSAEPWRPADVRPSDLMAVYAGAHGIANGLDALLDAAVELERQGQHDVKIVLIGEGKVKPDLERRARDEGLSCIIFHPPLSKTRLAGLLAGTNVGLQILADVPAFYYGTSPNKFFDYIASGLPVLINYPGWLADLITEWECGYVVPASDPRGLATALVHAAMHRAELAEMGNRARDLAQGQFDRRVLSERFVSWLELAASA